MGIIYGLILSLIAAKLFVIILDVFYHIGPGTRVYQSSGLLLAMIYSIVGATFFSPVFGNLSNKRTRIFLGCLFGILAGANLGRTFLYVPSVQTFGSIFFIAYTAYFGFLGGLLIGLTNKVILDKLVNKTKSYEVVLNSQTAGIWSAIIGGLFAVLVSIISVKSDFWIKSDAKLYIVVYSSPFQDEAKQYVSKKINKDYDPEIYFTSNSNYAVTIGYYEPEKAKYIKDNAIRNGLISNTSFLTGSKGFIKKVYP